MSVLITIAVIVIVMMAAGAVYSRLARLRNQVTQAWQLFAADQTKLAARTVYNARVKAYNDILTAFPYSVVAAFTGFKPARYFEPPQKSEI